MLSIFYFEAGLRLHINVVNANIFNRHLFQSAYPHDAVSSTTLITDVDILELRRALSNRCWLPFSTLFIKYNCLLAKFAHITISYSDTSNDTTSAALRF